MREFLSLDVADVRSRGMDPNTLAPRPSGLSLPWVENKTGDLFFVVGSGHIGNDFKDKYTRLDAWTKQHGKPHPQASRARDIMARCKSEASPRSSLRGRKPTSFIEEERRVRPLGGVKSRKGSKRPRSVLDSPVIIDGALTEEGIRQKVRQADEKLATGRKTEVGEAALDAALESKEAPLTALFDRKMQTAIAPRKDALESDDPKEVLVELTSPERVVETLQKLKFGDAEHVAALVGIIRDIGSLDKDRIAALGELREIIKETSIAMGVSVGEVKRAITTGDWNLIAERTLAERVATGDIEAIKMAIFSNKISSLKIPTKDPSVAVLTINGAQVELTPEQQQRLSRLDDLLVLPDERAERKVVTSRVVDADTPEDTNSADQCEPSTEGMNDECGAE